MPKSARYHIDRANSIVFTSKRLPLQPVSSERNHQVADKFRKVSCLNVYGRKRGRVGVKQCMHSFHNHYKQIPQSPQSLQANTTKHYIGMTANTFKERYRNHIKSFNHKRYSNDTELSKYIWKLKDNKQDFDITWSVLKQSISYTGGSKRCNLCLEEKLCILKDKNKQNLLNKKSEIVSTCNHRKKHLINNLRNGRNACIV